MDEYWAELMVCARPPFGWRCTRRDLRHVVQGHGPCAALPKWWNVRARWQMR